MILLMAKVIKIIKKMLRRPPEMDYNDVVLVLEHYGYKLINP